MGDLCRPLVARLLSGAGGGNKAARGSLAGGSGGTPARGAERPGLLRFALPGSRQCRRDPVFSGGSRGTARDNGLAAGVPGAPPAPTPPATGGDLNNFTSFQGGKRAMGEPVGGLDQMLLPVKN